ncbi:MAG TPA: MFS transporter [Clostridiales bacterium]|nr:MFS transporter [Clostridiales bacterium]
MTAFTVVALSQFLSILGTDMTVVALTIWAWRETGAATALALLGFFVMAPTVLFSPLAGALVDRWNRKLVMMLADIATGVATAAILALYLADLLEMWHLFVGGAFVGVFQSFHFPAYSAAATLMVPKDQYSRASAMISLAQAAGAVFAPIGAGALIGVIGVGGILAIDLVTLALALGALLLVHVPQPEVSAAGLESRGSLWREAGYGFRYILARPSLLGLQLLFTVGNLLSDLSGTLAAPLVLARTGDNALALGTVQSTGAVGGIVGGLVLSAWGGPRRKIHGVLAGWAGCFLLGLVFFGLGRTVPTWAAAMFLSAAFGTLISASNQAIWQRKVPPDVQGRVFSVRALIAQVAGPLGMLIAGPLADHVLEPGMRPGGALVPVFGGLVGTGPGAGMALVFIFAGVLGLAGVIVAYSVRAVRDVEDIVPDYDAAQEPAPGTSIEESASDGAAQPLAGPVPRGHAGRAGRTR